MKRAVKMAAAVALTAVFGCGPTADCDRCGPGEACVLDYNFCTFARLQRQRCIALPRSCTTPQEACRSGSTCDRELDTLVAYPSASTCEVTDAGMPVLKTCD
jgi:hypothetical protein